MNYNDVKNEARHLQKKDGISYSKALESVSKKHGFKNWNSLDGFLKKEKEEEKNFENMLKALSDIPKENRVSYKELEKTPSEKEEILKEYFSFSDIPGQPYRTKALDDIYAHDFKKTIQPNASLEDMVKWYETRLLNMSFNICGCMGPSFNEPVCPCAMNDVIFVHGMYLFFKEIDGFITFQTQDKNTCYKIVNHNGCSIYKSV